MKIHSNIYLKLAFIRSTESKSTIVPQLHTSAILQDNHLPSNHSVFSSWKSGNTTAPTTLYCARFWDSAGLAELTKVSTAPLCSYTGVQYNRAAQTP